MVHNSNKMKGNKIFFTWLIIFSLGLVMNNCGSSSVPNNDFLGQLPALSDMYQSKIEEFKKKAKQATNINDAYKYEKKYKLTKEESDVAMSEYVNENLLNAPIPFDMDNNDIYEIIEVVITDAHRNRINIKGDVLIKKDLKNKYGGFKKFFFAYIKAIDINGEIIGEPSVMSANMKNGDPFIAGIRVSLNGSIGNLRHFGSFEKIKFITKEEYDKLK